MRLQQQLKLNLEKNNKIMYVKKAIVIQKYVRRYIVISGSILRKKKTERRQKRLEQLQKKKSMASIRIQGYIRGYLVRRREELKIEEQGVKNSKGSKNLKGKMQVFCCKLSRMHG